MPTVNKKAASPYAGEAGNSLIESYQKAQKEGGYDAGLEVCRTSAELLSTSVKSVIAFLARKGVYVKKTPTTKTGEAVVRKSELVDKLQIVVPALSEADCTSLEKCNKTALVALIAAIPVPVES